MATARARAVRHLIESMRNCLRGEAAGALLATVEQQVTRLLSDRDDCDELERFRSGWNRGKLFERRGPM